MFDFAVFKSQAETMLSLIRNSDRDQLIQDIDVLDDGDTSIASIVVEMNGKQYAVIIQPLEN